MPDPRSPAAEQPDPRRQSAAAEQPDPRQQPADAARPDPRRGRAPSGSGLAKLWRRGQRGWPPGFVLLQFPNAPLLAFLAATIVMRLASGSVHDAAWAISRVALTIWAYEEAARGANWLRRGVGVVVLVVLTARLAGDLG